MDDQPDFTRKSRVDEGSGTNMSKDMGMNGHAGACIRYVRDLYIFSGLFS